MAQLAIFADIHGNWEALETAVQYVKARGIREWLVLGDTVGYGADPNRCLEWVLNHAAVVLMGNHEKAVIDPRLREWFSEDARAAILWTEQVLADDFKKAIHDLPYVYLAKKWSLAHGSPDHPEEFRYLFDDEDARSSFRTMEKAVCLVGHTHIPACFSENRHAGTYLKPGLLHLRPGERYILNPGSIGQPRDYDPRLSFGIYDPDEETFEIVRLPYDNKSAADKIRAAGLPPFLADRLL